jgi:hypothetical protein
MSQEIFQKKRQKRALGAEHPRQTPCFELPEQIACRVLARPSARGAKARMRRRPPCSDRPERGTSRA